MSRRPDAPSWGVVVVGGFATLAVVGFVIAVAFGGGTRSTPGEKVRVVRRDAGGLTVLAGRCLDERVTGVELRDPGGPTLWLVAADKGSIDRRFDVGGRPPLGFTTRTPLASPPEGRVRAVVTFEQDGEATTDARTVDVDRLPVGDEALDAAPGCGGDEGPGATALLFAVGAAFVVAGYVTTLLRLRRP